MVAMDLLSIFVTFHLSSNIVDSFPIQNLPVNNGTDWWYDDFVFNLDHSSDSEGWMYGDASIDEEIVLEGSTTRYHGDFYFESRFSSFSRDFRCPFDDPSSIMVRYSVRYCKTSNQDTITVEVDGTALRHTIHLNVIDGYDNSDQKVNQICPGQHEKGSKNKNEIGERTFTAETTALIYHQNPFTVDFKVGFDYHQDHIFIYDISLACNTAPQEEVTVPIDIADVDFGDVEIPEVDRVWNPVTNKEPQYVYDGHVVSLTGSVKWSRSARSLPMGEPKNTDTIKRGLIGRIGDAKAWPLYDSIFVVTNEFGLICSIEIGGACGGCNEGKITLKAWGIASLFYETSNHQFSLIETPYNGTAESISKLQPLTDPNVMADIISVKWDSEAAANARDLSTVAVVSFDGITYIAQGAFDEQTNENVLPQPRYIERYDEPNVNVYVTWHETLALCALSAVLGTVMTLLSLYCVHRNCSKYSSYATLQQMKTVNYIDTETE